MNCGISLSSTWIVPRSIRWSSSQHLIILRSIEFSTQFREDFLNEPIICDLQIMVVQPGRLWLDFNLLLQFPAIPWTCSHVALDIDRTLFPAAPSELSGMAHQTAHQFPAKSFETDSTLENTFLGFGLCFGQCPACSCPRPHWQTPNPAADLQDIGNFPTKGRGIALCSGLLKSNTLISDLPPQVLLPSSFREFSSRCWSPFQLNKNDCEKT